MTVSNDGEYPTYPVKRKMSTCVVICSQITRYSPYNIGWWRHRLQLLLVESRGSLGSWLSDRPSVHHLSRLRVETASDVLPQVQLIVIDGLQYAVLAKCVNGANVLTIAELSVVISF